MARFYGKVGYGNSIEISPGVWDSVITEKTYAGDVVRTSIRLRSEGQVNENLTSGNSISIVADSYATERISAIKYVEWSGTLWSVTEVEQQSPRLILRLGGVYNGPKPTPSTSD
jgi:hypothetical protein